MWYYVLNNKQNGPTDEAGIKSLLDAGTIVPTTLVWQEGMADWKSLSQTQLAYLITPPAAPRHLPERPLQRRCQLHPLLLLTQFTGSFIRNTRKRSSRVINLIPSLMLRHLILLRRHTIP